jgi:hypothetical protein
MVSRDSLLPVLVTSSPSNYDLPSGLQINLDERLIDFYNRFILDDATTPPEELVSVKRYGDTLLISDCRSNNMELKFQRTLRIPRMGKSYSLPAYFGAFPLLNVDVFFDRLPPHMQKRGGLFIPMFQREALSLGFQCMSRNEGFAIRIYAGSVNAISGKAVQSQCSDGEQDYVVIPNQRRLDGFFAGKG